DTHRRNRLSCRRNEPSSALSRPMLNVDEVISRGYPGRPRVRLPPVGTTQADKAERFLRLHKKGDPLLMPNAWDAGSAAVLVWLGFQALATTSSGHAATFGRLDGGVTRDEALGHATDLSVAVGVPVSADLENAFADEPDGVAETIRAAKATGLAGCSVEDNSGRAEDVMHESGMPGERVEAAAERANSG